MDLDTVGGLVNELLSAYDAALEYYTKWQRRKWQENHYRTHDKGKLSGSGSCGLSTSLNISGPIIRKAYNEAAEALGEPFSIGDEPCREVLHGNLKRLQEHIGTLYEAMSRDTGPLALAEILQASEAVRISTVDTLAGQRKRLPVVGNSRPTSLLAPTSSTAARRQSSRVSAATATATATATAGVTSTTTAADGSTEKSSSGGGGGGGIGIEDNDDVRTLYRHSGSNRSPFQSEPPSPPPTPKMIPDDLQSTCSTTTTTAAASVAPRPKASVFSVFCPEAMQYQVDIRKAMPPTATMAPNSKKSGKCRRCGYDWYGWLTTATPTNANADDDDHLNLMVKDGFRMSPRFLGKSHCEGGVFGCVLCTSSGTTETYGDANALRDHINAAHTKWQMLHDSDMAGRLGAAAVIS